MYASGIPLGLLTDARGPRLTTILGAITLGVGYYPIYQAYVHGEGSLGVTMLSFFSFLTGFGSCSSFSASIKTGMYKEQVWSTVVLITGNSGFQLP